MARAQYRAMRPARRAVGASARQQLPPGAAQRRRNLSLSPRREIRLERSELRHAVAAAVGKLARIGENHARQDRHADGQRLDRAPMRIVLSQRVLEPVTLAAERLRPGRLACLPEDAAAVVFGLDDEDAGRRQRQMIDLSQPAAAVGQDQIVRHAPEQPLQRTPDQRLPFLSAPARRAPPPGARQRGESGRRCQGDGKERKDRDQAHACRSASAIASGPCRPVLLQTTDRLGRTHASARGIAIMGQTLGDVRGWSRPRRNASRPL